MNGSDFSQDKQWLLDEIKREVRETASYTGRAELKAETYRALSRVCREQFVPPQNQELAYVNSALSIGCGQTISQPYIVALMTDLLEIDSDSVVLEIGTGSGYQTAVLAEIAKRVYSIEAIPELAEQAKTLLQSLGYKNIVTRCGNGWEGWPEQAPYDAVIVTAAPESIPPALIEQLKPGGHMAIPVGGAWRQELVEVTKDENGEVRTRDILPVAFVPLVGDDV